MTLITLVILITLITPPSCLRELAAPTRADIPKDQLFSYVDMMGERAPPSNGRLWMNQAHWQYSADSIIRGILAGSSILKVACTQSNSSIF